MNNRPAWLLALAVGAALLLPALAAADNLPAGRSISVRVRIENMDEFPDLVFLAGLHGRELTDLPFEESYYPVVGNEAIFPWGYASKGGHMITLPRRSFVDLATFKRSPRQRFVDLSTRERSSIFFNKEELLRQLFGDLDSERHGLYLQHFYNLSIRDRPDSISSSIIIGVQASVLSPLRNIVDTLRVDTGPAGIHLKLVSRCFFYFDGRSEILPYGPDGTPPNDPQSDEGKPMAPLQIFFLTLGSASTLVVVGVVGYVRRRRRS